MAGVRCTCSHLRGNIRLSCQDFRHPAVQAGNHHRITRSFARVPGMQFPPGTAGLVLLCGLCIAGHGEILPLVHGLNLSWLPKLLASIAIMTRKMISDCARCRHLDECEAHSMRLLTGTEKNPIPVSRLSIQRRVMRPCRLYRRSGGGSVLTFWRLVQRAGNFPRRNW